ncbi:MAG TPA: AsmA-like C-terminal region-containing protein [Xanthobacteraceae bacterium]
MQSTLLGLAVALIVALVAALVGPLFIDWGRWRASFEAEATRLVGMPVRVSGEIDARLLPTPRLRLNGIEIGEPGHEPRLRAHALDVEFALTPLMRGEWRASQLRLDAPQLMLGVDAGGRIEVPPVSIAFDPDQLSFDRVEVANGRAVLLDAARGTRTVLDQLSFNGDIRSLVGPFRGDGAFVVSGRQYGYRVSGRRRGDDGGMRLHLALDPHERAPTMETEGTLWVEGGRPRYEGTLTLTGPASLTPPAGQTGAASAWHATSKVKATPTDALFEQVDFQYGPDERAVRLAGTADLKLGANPSFEAVLSARQVDLDRVLRVPDAAPRTPIALMRDLTDMLAQFTPPPVPVQIGIGVDNVTVGDASLVGLHGDMHAEADGWSLDNVEFRAPGATQVHASGLLSLKSDTPEFAGPARIDSADPKALIAWLEGRKDTQRAAVGSFSARGDVTLGGTRVAVERLKASFDGKTVEGRFAYAFAGDHRPARLDAALNAAQIDLDGALSFASHAFAGTTFELPREIALKLNFGHATYAGVEAKGASADLKFDAKGLDIERLAIADFGGAVVNGQGHIDTSASSWRGSLAFSLQAQQLGGVATLAAKFAPGAAELLRTTAQRAAPARLSAKLEVAPTTDGVAASTGSKTDAKLTVDGTVAGVGVNLVAEGNGDAASPSAANIRLDGRLDAADGAGLAALLGLDRLAVLDHHPANLILAAHGPAGGDLRVDATFSGAGVDAGARGTLRLADARPRGALEVSFAATNARLTRGDAAAAVPLELTTRLSLDGDQVKLAAFDAKVADTSVKGELALVLGHPLRLAGYLDADTLDAAAVLAAAIGSPVARRAGVMWSEEPFGPGPLADVDGRLAFKVAHARFVGGLTGDGLQGIVRFEPSAVGIDKIEGRVGGGRFSARATLRTASSGLSAALQASLNDADLAALLPGGAGASGRISFQFDATGIGRSPAALIGALRGRGSAAGENLQFAGLDPQAIETASEAAERGSLLDPQRVGDIVRTALAGGALDIPDAGGTLAIDDGRLTFAPLAAPAQGADVTIMGGYDIGRDALDVGFDLAGAPSADVAAHGRPRLTVSFKGPLAAPRRSVDVTALVGWLTARRVEREAKRLEAAEREAKRVQAQEAAEALRRAQEAARQAALKEAAQKAAAQRAAEQAAVATRPAVPGAERAPDLPPTIEIPSVPAHPQVKRRPSPSHGAATHMPAPPLVITPPAR